jgi:hypothetical protein
MITTMTKIQFEELKSGDVTSLPPYRNLVPRFRGEEKPRLRIGT